MLYNKTVDISQYTASIAYSGVVLKEIKKVSNPHYLFLSLEISSAAKAGTVPINFVSGKKKFTYRYELKNKDASQTRIQGFNSSDVIYLIMPDRFANGDVKNDSLPGMLEGTNRAKPEAGTVGFEGDLRSSWLHERVRCNCAWLNPVLKIINPAPATTVCYHWPLKIDKRFGSNEDMSPL